jgi:hypothetical protein
MHPSLEQLLDFRDGVAPGPIREHIAACDRCAAEVRRLGDVAEALRGLPDVEPGRDCWPALRAEAAGLNRRRSFRRAAAGAAAAAIVVAVVVLRHGQRPSPAVVSQSAVAQGPKAPPSGQQDLAKLIRQSQRLEALLQRVDSQPRLQSGGEAAAITSLQDQVALVDGRIAQVQSKGDPAALVGLWQQRVKLLDALVEVQVDPRRSAEI